MTQTAVVLGVGSTDGLGAAIGRQFAAQGHHVVIAGRTAEKIDAVAHDITEKGGSTDTFVTDVTDPQNIAQLFAHAPTTGTVNAVIYNAGNNAIIPFGELSAEQYEYFWRVCNLGAMMTAKAALPVLLEQETASLLFTGASGSLRGKANFAHFASAKAGLRMLSQSLAREYGPQGIHVGHVIVDGLINGAQLKTKAPEYLEKLGPNGSLSPDEIAKNYWMLHSQHPSCWTQELDVRPFKENW